MKKTLVIAEAGVNHNGDLYNACGLVDAAVEAGADIVKFQTFKADSLASKGAAKAAYQKRTTGADESQHEMLKRLELSEDYHFKLADYCSRNGIEFLSTPFDEESLRFLVDAMSLTRLKISSGEITNAPLLLAFARSGCDLILSTGMASLSEVEQALGVLAWGMGGKGSLQDEDPFMTAWADRSARQVVQQKVVLLHCTSQYPAPESSVNLRAMDTLQESFGIPVGYSDHTVGIAISLAAVARGAVVIEKHFTLDRNQKGPDHSASLEPGELKELVSGIRKIEEALGDGVKVPHATEMNTREVARKSLVAARKITKGELFSEENLTVKRPQSGRSPFAYWETLGTRADRDYDADEAIR